MRLRVDDTTVHYVEHGTGSPAVVLHGGGVDHRESEACFEPVLNDHLGLRRVYPDLPGTGRTPAAVDLASADDVLGVLIGFLERLTAGVPALLVGHSVGGYYARGVASRRPDLVSGLALVCPLTDDLRDVPEHRPVITDDELDDELGDELGDEDFRAYFVIQTAAMLERYERFVAPALPLADQAAAQRIGAQWRLDPPPAAFDGPTLIIAGRQDSTVGYAAALALADDHPRATVAVLDDAGHALPHEQPELLRSLVRDWVGRVRRRTALD